MALEKSLASKTTSGSSVKTSLPPLKGIHALWSEAQVLVALPRGSQVEINGHANLGKCVLVLLEACTARKAPEQQ